MTLWDEVGDGCFRRRYASFDLNIGVVRGRDALLVVDTRADLRQADELLVDLAELGGPVRWVVNSHWHFDHFFGNQRFVERAARRLESLPASVDVAPDVELWGHIEMPRTLRAHEAQLRTELREVYGDEAGDEYDKVVLTPPERLVVDRQVLDLGDRGVELAHFGRGHTSNDLVVVVPEPDGVVFAGDLIEESAPPHYGDDSYPLAWSATASALAGIAAATFVPGHGGLMTPSEVADQAAEIGIVADTIRQLHAAGVGADDALREGGDAWPYPPNGLAEAVQRGYGELRGAAA